MNSLMSSRVEKQKIDYQAVSQAFWEQIAALGDSEKAIAICDEVLARLGDATGLDERVDVSGILAQKANLLHSNDRGEEALAVYDDLLARFGEAQEFGIQEHVAGAYVGKSAALLRLNRLEEAIAVCEELLARFGNSPELRLRELASLGHFNRGSGFRSLGRIPEAIAAYGQFCESRPEEHREAVNAIIEGLVAKKPTIHPIIRKYSGPFNPYFVAEIIEKYVPIRYYKAIMDLAKKAFRPAEREVSAGGDTLEWPSAGWLTSPERGFRKHGAIVAYLRRTWKPFLDLTGAVVTLEILNQKDEGAGTALRSYLRSNPMPNDLRIRTSKQLKAELAEAPKQIVPVERFTHG